MHVILVPGLWLDASTWDPVLPALAAAGHTAHPLTMPGVGRPAEESADVGMADWVAAVVAAIDALDGPTALVGHSGGGNVVWGAADARPDRVARVVLVDTALPPAGSIISEFPVVDGVVPFPGWDLFEEPEIADLDGPTRDAAAARTFSVPARVPTDPLRLVDGRRHAVPVTILSGGESADSFRSMVSEWPGWAAELEETTDTEVVTLGSGHWPQLSIPDRLADAIVTALR